jgi:hypothetical protein
LGEADAIEVRHLRMGQSYGLKKTLHIEETLLDEVWHLVGVTQWLGAS